MNIRDEILEPDCFYHIFNRGINGNLIFSEEQNYHYFLQKFSKYLNEVCDVYAYCLMPNHFHFLIKIKSSEELDVFISKHTKNQTNIKGLHAATNIVSKQIGKLISSYSQSYNKVKKRHGPLLESPFKRVRITTNEYLINLILYIHLNPTDLGILIQDYKYSSYLAMISKAQTNIKRNEVLNLFENLDNFIFCHNQEKEFSNQQ
jgi:REP element-mobilizing transposase RayT